MTVSLKSLILLAAVIAWTYSSANECAAQGWLQKSTGIKTPESIQKIAPNGISNKRPGSKDANVSNLGGPSGLVPDSPNRNQNTGGNIELDNNVQTRKRNIETSSQVQRRPSTSSKKQNQSVNPSTNGNSDAAIIVDAIGQIIGAASQNAQSQQQPQFRQSPSSQQRQIMQNQQWNQQSNGNGGIQQRIQSSNNAATQRRNANGSQGQSRRYGGRP